MHLGKATIVALALTTIVLGLPTYSIAEIVAGFTDGNDDTNLGTNPPTVDSFRGTAGGGWAGGWTIAGNFNPEFAATVVDATPVNGGGNYLSATLNSPSGLFSQAAVSRQYFDPTESGQLSDTHTISFDFRTDVALSEFGTIEDRFQIFDSVNPGQSATQTSNTWIVAAYGAASANGPQNIVSRNWGFINGNPSSSSFSSLTFVDTGMTITSGVTYHFEITTNPADRTWSAMISDGENMFQSGSLNWRNRDATAAGGYVHWGMQKMVSSAGDPYQYSLDNVSISIDADVSTLGDYNSDGNVDAADYTVWRDTFGQSVTEGSGADGNQNGMIDQEDYGVWKSNFGGGGGGGMASSLTVPEPGGGSIAIAFLSMGAVAWRRRGGIAS